MTETGFVSPWAESGPPTPPAPPAPTRTPGLAWNLVSTAVLFLWLAWQMGWIWALAGIVGVFVHEFGHVLAINAAGCGPSSIRIIPLLGGAATVPRAPDTEYKGVLIALAGPAFGLLAAIPFFIAAGYDPHWRGGALFIAGINLLNLVPAPPLDGSKALGPILARIHPLLERLALLAVGVLAVVWTVSRGSLILPVFIGLSVAASLRAPRLRPPARPLSLVEWAASLGLYFAVAAICAAVLLAALQGGGPAWLRLFGFGGARP
ncbi:MAG: M50 family metallopeptidase [Caulobacteraceae bacterium]|nr:M50 family metallopeptidase [Caulobacteraceae bacterium]